MRNFPTAISILFAAALWTVEGRAVTGEVNDKVEVFDISAEPLKGDWQRFNRFPVQKRQGLWQYFTKQGKTLKDWSWGWRIGWIRACTNDKTAYCPTLVEEALNDQALVVRAEAASAYGQLHEATKDKAAIALLEKAYQNKGNYRNDKPLFVQNRILEAIKKIGGEHALITGTKLAAVDPNAKLYWQKLNRF